MVYLSKGAPTYLHCFSLATVKRTLTVRKSISVQPVSSLSGLDLVTVLHTNNNICSVEISKTGGYLYSGHSPPPRVSDLWSFILEL